MIRGRSSKEEIALREMLRDRRKSLGLRQADLALRLGMPQSFVSKYESGERLLTFVEVLVILEVLSLDIKTVAKNITTANEAKS
ncbi:MAG: helix-turn-helix transcriptional regulator [Geobacter sp.]|nr:helix-turn-helix transcriptional regulator [Geobacter sp.]